MEILLFINTGEGLPWDAGTGKPLSEWVMISPDYMNNWEKYTGDALEFIRKKFKL